MIKKIVLASAVVIASVVSLKLGDGTPSMSAPAAAKACIPISCTYGPPCGCL
jgi:hypothetical protein